VNLTSTRANKTPKNILAFGAKSGLKTSKMRQKQVQSAQMSERSIFSRRKA